MGAFCAQHNAKVTLLVLGPTSYRGLGGCGLPTYPQAILSGQPAGVEEFNSILTLSTQREHQIPQIKGVVPQDYPPHTHTHTHSHTLQMPVPSPGCYLCFVDRPTTEEVYTTSSLGSINLLKQLTELRETFYLLDHQLITKRHGSGTARWKRCAEQGTWEGMPSFHTLSRWATLPAPPWVHQPRISPNSVLWGL